MTYPNPRHFLPYFVCGCFGGASCMAAMGTLAFDLGLLPYEPGVLHLGVIFGMGMIQIGSCVVAAIVSHKYNLLGADIQ